MKSVYIALAIAACCLATPGRTQGQTAAQATRPAQRAKLPFEAEIEAFEASDRVSPPPQGAVLFIGSSSIRFWTSLARDFPELTVINRGFGGSEIADSVRYAPRIVLPYRPRMIVMYAGCNDIYGGKSAETVLADFQAFVGEVAQSLPKTRIVFISMNPAVSRWKKEPEFVAANRLIARYIRATDRRGRRLVYIDTHSGLLTDRGDPRPEIYRADGLHLNALGYSLWTRMLHPRIAALAGRESATR